MDLIRLYQSVSVNELPFLELIRERVYKFGRNNSNLVWRQDKLLQYFNLFDKSLDIYLDNQRHARENAKLFASDKNVPGKPVESRSRSKNIRK